jgi:predicted 2-oxoglutarate/Fe(II)-dependent dioxygenase YbiX
VSLRSAAAPALDAVVDATLRRCHPFREALSPSAVSQVIYARYGVSDGSGRHVDAVMTGMPPMRPDVSLTIFLSDPAAYDGGELRLCYGLADHTDFKLASGAAVAYPSTPLHEVRPVAGGRTPRRRAVGAILLPGSRYPPARRRPPAMPHPCQNGSRGVAVELSQVLANLERKFVGP